MSLSRSFLQMKAENQNFLQMTQNLARKLTSSIENKFMMQTQIHYCAVVMLTDVQAYWVTFLICLFRPALTTAAIYRKTAEAKLYTL